MKHNFFWKILAFVRFIIIKVVYPRSFKNCNKGLIGSDCHLFLKYKNSNTVIGNKFILLGNNEVLNSGMLKIGCNFSMNCYSRIVCYDSIEIGNNVMMAEFVTIIDHNHAFMLHNGNLNTTGHTSSPIKIGNNVWIADKVSILKGVTIGSNVVIGANSVVTKNIPSNSIAAGIPAKVLKTI